MTVGMLAVGALAASACGSTKIYANKPSPPTPVDLTVYVNDAKVSVSPAHVGAGIVVFTVTNRASQAESLTVQPTGASGGQPLADTGPINPQVTAQLTVDLSSYRDYTIGASGGTTTDASLSGPHSSIQPATLHVGAARPSSSGDLMTP